MEGSVSRGRTARYHRAVTIGWTLLTAAVGVTTFAAAPSSGPTAPDDIVDRYLEAVRTEDWPTMTSLLAEDARYLDTAMTIFERPPIDLEGPSAIVGFFRRANADSGTEEVRYDVRARFTSGDTTVLDMKVHVRTSGAFWDVPDPTIEIEATLVTIVRVDGDRIIYHADYTDDAAALSQIEAMRGAGESASANDG